MKKVCIFIIHIYQKIPGPWHKMCRHIPTCSNYMIESIDRYGVIRGMMLGLKRILKCNPWGTFGFDPVPKNLDKKGKKL